MLAPRIVFEDGNSLACQAGLNEEIAPNASQVGFQLRLLNRTECRDGEAGEISEARIFNVADTADDTTEGVIVELDVLEKLLGHEVGAGIKMVKEEDIATPELSELQGAIVARRRESKRANET
jgi:hypothetical protein